jgi:hypothetical protein
MEMEAAMHSMLSLLFGAVLVGLVYGLSFFPSATLNDGDEADEAISQVQHENPGDRDNS